MDEAGSSHTPSADPRTVEVGGVEFDAMSESQVVQQVVRGVRDGVGGWIVTPNIDIVRMCAADPTAAHLVRQATCVVADGMPVIWAARIAGNPLPERVTGSSLIFSVSAALAAQAGSVYLIGGDPGTPEQAAENLRSRYEGLRVAGADSPPFGFEADPAMVSAIVARVSAADPDVVFVGLGFPKQERLIARLRDTCPRQWYVGCGAAVPMAAGAVARAPAWAQRWGMEWLHRLATEPRRLARRYLVEDLPYAATLLGQATWHRLAARRQRAS